MTSDKSTGDTEHDELEWEDLAVDGSPYEFQDISVGEEVWIPASFKREGGFRAVKIKVLDRATVGSYEEDHALDEWDVDTGREQGGR